MHLTQLASSKNPFRLSDGTLLEDLTVAWSSWGQPSANLDNVILVFPVLTTSYNAAGLDSQGPGASWWTSHCHQGWWNDFIGPDRAIDTNKWCVICASLLGGCYGTTGPDSINPSTGQAWGSSFPFPQISDLVDVQVRLLEHLGIQKLHTVVGASFGGYLALDLAVRYPQFVENVVSVASGMRVTSAMQFANFQQAMAIESDPNFQQGLCDSGNHPCWGLALARTIALQQYVVPDELEIRCNKREKKDILAPFPWNYPINRPLESWLLHNGLEFAKRFNPHSYLRILHAWQTWNPSLPIEEYLSPCRQQRWLVFSIDSDICFPTQEQILLTDALKSAGVSYQSLEVSSRLGHDSFLKEPALYTDALQQFLIKNTSVVDESYSQQLAA